MEIDEAAASLRKMKKKQAKNDLIQQAKKKKKRLEKALATSAGILSELLKKKQKKKETIDFGRSRMKRACRGIYVKKNPSLVEAAQTSHDSRRTNLPPTNAKTSLQMESETVGVKAKYKDKIIKFELRRLSSTMNNLLD